jgi:glutamine cyclotransferase
MRLYFLTLLVLLSFACNGTPTNSNNRPKNANVANTAVKTGEKVPVYTYEIVKTYPHDPAAFTQGLIFHNGLLYEGTGGDGDDDFRSSLRKVELESGKVLKKFDLAPDYFGEGITIFNDKIYQLTWREQTAFVYDVNDFKLLREFRYAGEGWGLTHDGTNLIMSDGTHVIRFVNPETFETVRTLVVNDENGRPLMEINELEYIKGEIWANIWQKGWIIRIDPSSGKVVGRIDFNKLADEVMNKDRRADVLNGIAYDAAADRYFITGKKWRNLYEVRIVPKQ